jgi:hypothetical protein
MLALNVPDIASQPICDVAFPNQRDTVTKRYEFIPVVTGDCYRVIHNFMVTFHKWASTVSDIGL